MQTFEPYADKLVYGSGLDYRDWVGKIEPKFRKSVISKSLNKFIQYSEFCLHRQDNNVDNIFLFLWRIRKGKKSPENNLSRKNCPFFKILKKQNKINLNMNMKINGLCFTLYIE